MTRKDYILIATELRERRKVVFVDLLQRVAEGSRKYRWSFDLLAGFDNAIEALVSALQSDNPRFNRDHFLSVVRGERDLNSRPSRNETRKGKSE